MYQKDLQKDQATSHLIEFRQYLDCFKDYILEQKVYLCQRFETIFFEKVYDVQVFMPIKKSKEATKRKGKEKVGPSQINTLYDQPFVQSNFQEPKQDDIVQKQPWYTQEQWVHNPIFATLSRPPPHTHVSRDPRKSCGFSNGHSLSHGMLYVLGQNQNLGLQNMNIYLPF